MIDRRNLLGFALGALVNAVGPGAQARVIQAEPKPMFVALEIPADVCCNEADIERIHEQWRKLWQGCQDMPRLVIPPPGCTIKAITEPGK